MRYLKEWRTYIDFFIRKHLKPEQSGEILEIGIGDSTTIVNSIVGRDRFKLLDIRNDSIWKPDYQLDLQYIFPNTSNYDIHPEQFDFIVCSEVLEHIPKPWLAIDMLEQLLKPNGKLIITVPCNLQYHGGDVYGDYYRFMYFTLEKIINLKLIDKHVLDSDIPSFPIGIATLFQKV